MKISKVSVYGLFDRFNHDILFSADEPITIIIGPNGFGKTMILRILNGLFNSTLQSLEPLPFQQVGVYFDNGSVLKVQRRSNKPSTTRPDRQHVIEIDYFNSTGQIGGITSEDTQISEDDLPFSVNIIEDIVPSLDQIGPAQWRNLSNGDILDLDDVLTAFGEQLSLTFRSADPKFAWLHDLRQAMPVRFIGIERLTHTPSYESRRPWTRHPDFRFQSDRTVRHYSDILANMVKNKLTEYGTLSQSLDRTFPVRLMDTTSTPTLSSQEVMEKLREVEQKRSRIVDAGLLGQEDQGLGEPTIQSPVDDSRRGVLAVYVQDALRKLNIFDELYVRVNTFTRIANARFLYKEVSVSTNGLKVTALDGSELDLEMLSSGEQHELVLLYDLLFGTAENSLIMIDEPELSLHVAWQDEFLNDLLGMAELSAFRVLLATHSPQIISDRWDLAVKLRGPDDT